MSGILTIIPEMLYSITELISVIEYNDAHGFCMADVAFSDQNPAQLINETASHFVNEFKIAELIANRLNDTG